jgi:hypothetical protein
MGYLSVWKVLDQMVADFRKRGAAVPDKIMSDLKSARTILSAKKTPQGSSGILEEIEAYLVNVESYLISEGEKRFGKEYANEWLRKIKAASGKVSDDEEEKERFIWGFPRQQKWIRVKPSTDLPPARIKALANESSLSIKSQNDGCILVYGTDKHVKDFVKKMTTKHESKTRKCRQKNT